jgi:hypothetical protein
MKTSVRTLKQLVNNVIAETRGRLSPQEVLTTYEDLYLNSRRSNRAGEPQMEPGVVSIESLASFMGATPEELAPVLAKAGLIVDKSGNVSERGMTPYPPTFRAVR